MLVEIHLLQNQSPSNPNRDDFGAPKSAVFRGKLRARMSSQCLKNSIRGSEAFTNALKEYLGIRTKYFPEKFQNGKSTGIKIESKHGKRTFLRTEAEQQAWLKRKSEACGFTVDVESKSFSMDDEGWHGARKTFPEEKRELPPRADGSKRDSHLQFHSVLFKGELTVTDPRKLAVALASGIGSGKAFGFGLLSVARA